MSVDNFPKPWQRILADTSGGGAGFPVVEMDADSEKLSVTAGELVEMLGKTPVFVNAIITIDGNAVQTWVTFVHYMTQGNMYGFQGFAVIDGQTFEVLFVSETINDYPQIDQAD